MLTQVRQPLFCLGKLLGGQSAELDPQKGWRVRKGDRSFAVHWSKNSLATYMRIHRVDQEAETRRIAPVEVVTQPLEIRMLVEISEERDVHAQSPGWSLTADMKQLT